MKKLLPLSLLLTGCNLSSIQDISIDRSPDYRQSRVVNNLEIPPNLVAIENQGLTIPNENLSASYLASQQAARGEDGFITVLPELYQTQVQGPRIETAASPDAVWRWLTNYWNRSGIRLKTSDNLNGLMVTDWLEDKNKLPQGMISGVFSKLGLTDSGERDRYKVQLERRNGGTVINVSHVRATEEMKPARHSEVPDYYWTESKQGDAKLAAEMAKRLALEISQQLRRQEQNRGKR